jgi:hypothetical protein
MGPRKRPFSFQRFRFDRALETARLVRFYVRPARLEETRTAIVPGRHSYLAVLPTDVCSDASSISSSSILMRSPEVRVEVAHTRLVHTEQQSPRKDLFAVSQHDGAICLKTTTPSSLVSLGSQASPIPHVHAGDLIELLVGKEADRLVNDPRGHVRTSYQT